MHSCTGDFHPISSRPCQAHTLAVANAPVAFSLRSEAIGGASLTVDVRRSGEMKLSLVCTSVLLVVSSGFAQGTVLFANTPSTLASAGIAGQEAPISGSPGSYYFGLLISTAGSTSPAQFAFTGNYATNRGGGSLAGLFSAGPVSVVPGWAPCTVATYFVAGWSSSLGHDW